MTGLWISSIVAGAFLVGMTAWAMGKRGPEGYPDNAKLAIAVGLVAGALFLLVGFIGLFAEAIV